MACNCGSSSARRRFIIQGGTPETFPRFVDEVVPLLQARGLSVDYPGTTLRESLGLALPLINSKIIKRITLCETTLLLAVALAFSASSWGRGRQINGTG
ncbi:Putative monooxygenase MoxC [Klebsiella pneumoniae]|nr:Putative monooxygenase MoxC [Klebsiella pneumoniae]